MMRIFMAILCSLLAVCSVSARNSCHEGTDRQAAIYRLPPFERAGRCTKYFEGWHSEKHYPYYPKQNIIQSINCNAIKNKDIIPLKTDIPYDNNCLVKEKFVGKNQVPFYKIEVSLPLKRIHVSSKFGVRIDPFTKRQKHHNGIDLQARMGEKTYAMIPGTIIAVGRDKSRGCHVVIQHDNYTVIYCHLSTILVKQGQAIHPGEPVGFVGSTGRSTGPHLHLTLYKGHHPLDPQIMLDYIMEVLNK